MPQSTDTTLSSAVSQNSLNLIKPFSAEAPVNKGNPGAAVRAQTSESTVELSSVKRQQVDTANAFLKELQGARSVFQAATSAFQEIRLHRMLGATRVDDGHRQGEVRRDHAARHV